jgi:enterochelin esterase-like enzyme
VSVTLPGPRSGISRGGLVYLPPQYFEPRYAHTDFPVVELIHGTPGSPDSWAVNLEVGLVADQLISHHEMGPMVLVMPTMSVGDHFEECVNAPGALDDTYITQDVRTDIEARFRVSQSPAEWGIGGLSSGGYCAANLALRHPQDFGAAGLMDAYFRPTDGPAAAALDHNLAAERANDPLLAARALAVGASPLPSFWIAAGTGSAGDIISAEAFAGALHGVEQVTLYREPGVGHNLHAWRPATPRMLAWMWTQLAPPTLRIAFPIAGPVTNATLDAPHPPLRDQAGTSAHRSAHRKAARPGQHVAPSKRPVARLATAKTRARTPHDGNYSSGQALTMH